LVYAYDLDLVGGFKDELEAARAHDLIAIKLWGKFAYTNFPVCHRVLNLCLFNTTTFTLDY